MMRGIETDFDPKFAWLQPPILNAFTRLAIVADAKEGRMIARGYEATGAATNTLDLAWRAAAA
jgi:hypothetical protein